MQCAVEVHNGSLGSILSNSYISQQYLLPAVYALEDFLQCRNLLRQREVRRVGHGRAYRITVLNALYLGLALWVLILVVFFPIIGWGFLGLGVSPKLIPASLVPHVLFAVFLWGLCRLGFVKSSGETGAL